MTAYDSHVNVIFFIIQKIIFNRYYYKYIFKMGCVMDTTLNPIPPPEGPAQNPL